MSAEFSARPGVDERHRDTEGPTGILAGILEVCPSVKVSERDEKAGSPNSPQPNHSCDVKEL